MNRTPTRAALALPLLAALALMTGCSSSADTASATSSGSSTDTTCTTPYDTYVADLMKTGEKGMLMVMLKDSMPAPPSKGDNQWMIELHDMNSTPIDGATIEVTPFMPEHGHGSPVSPVITPMGTGGEYNVDEVNFSMPGVWEITVSASVPGGVSDEAIFTFCIAG